MTSFDVARWCEANRRGNAWRGYEIDQIAAEIHKAALDKLCAVVVDEQDSRKILGVCVAERATETQLRIKQLQCESDKAMSSMLFMFFQYYPTFELVATHGGQEKIYTNKLVRRMVKYFTAKADK